MATRIIGQCGAAPILPKNEVAPGDKVGIPLDYLGHPCQIAEAYREFVDFLDQPRETVKEDPRALARDIGMHLLDARVRTVETASTFEALLELLPRNGNTDAARAVASMAMEYAEKSMDRFYRLAAETLVALEFAGLAREVHHG
ncbi:MAG: hypothetical protein CMO32_25335 [Variovorax sp.]|nr:hypothetical protein [Variovorax sp.]